MINGNVSMTKTQRILKTFVDKRKKNGFFAINFSQKPNICNDEFYKVSENKLFLLFSYFLKKA